jgi:hypothetical protein
MRLASSESASSGFFSPALGLSLFVNPCVISFRFCDINPVVASLEKNQ